MLKLSKTRKFLGKKLLILKIIWMMRDLKAGETGIIFIKKNKLNLW